MDPKMDPKIVPFLGTVFEVPKSIDFGPIWGPFLGPCLETFISKVWTRVPTGSTFWKPLITRNGKRVEIKELLSMLEKVFEDDE